MPLAGDRPLPWEKTRKEMGNAGFCRPFPLPPDRTSPCEIHDRDGRIIGRLQRCHATPVQKIISLMAAGMFTNVRAFDRENGLGADIREINTFRTFRIGHAEALGPPKSAGGSPPV